ncbi:MAG: NADP(H)-dependent aldo-keto reductase [Bacteroidota bacterium]
MEYTTLGKTDIEVSKICLGTMTYGEQNTEAEAHEQLDYAISRGVNFIDTAEMYAVPTKEETFGLTEEYIGSWLQKRGRRDDVVIATKITGPASHLKYIRQPMGFGRPQLREAIEGSLRRMQTDYVDLYQLHWPERRTNYFGQLGYRHSKHDKWDDNLLEVLQGLDELVKEGKIRHFGISNETPWGMMRYIYLAEQHGLPRCASIQNPYNLLNRSFEVGLAEVVIRESAGLLAYSPMAFGMLSGKYHRGPKPESGRISLYKKMSRYSGELAYQATEAYLELADKYELSLAQLALGFVNAQPFLTSNIIGATSMAQLKENIDSVENKLKPTILNEINKIHHRIPNPAP